MFEFFPDTMVPVFLFVQHFVSNSTGVAVNAWVPTGEEQWTLMELNEKLAKAFGGSLGKERDKIIFIFGHQ